MQKKIKTFDLGPIADFYEGGILTHSCFCYVRQYNSENPNRFRIGLFVLADSTHYCVIYIDVYQVNNAVNIDIHAIAANLPTTIKLVVNGIITSGVGNDTDGARKLVLDHCHAYPEILDILKEDINVLAGGTCWKNSKWFRLKEDHLTLPRGC